LSKNDSCTYELLIKSIALLAKYRNPITGEDNDRMDDEGFVQGSCIKKFKMKNTYKKEIKNFIKEKKLKENGKLAKKYLYKAVVSEGATRVEETKENFRISKTDKEENKMVTPAKVSRKRSKKQLSQSSKRMKRSENESAESSVSRKIVETYMEDDDYADLDMNA
jgi:hypothetical protein